jgi:hypothetical protein
MKFTILQMEDRTKPLLSLFMNHNRDICETNNFEYVFMERSADHVPPYWGKIVELQRLLADPSRDYVMWLDSDAFLYKFDKARFTQFLDTNSAYSMIISGDMPPWQHGTFNAGSFIVKNDEAGRTIVDTWLSAYNPEKWTHSNGKWTTSGVWAGREYEQGAFMSTILSNQQFAQHIQSVHYSVLNNNSCIHNTDNTLVVHLAGGHKTNKDNIESCTASIQNEDYNPIVYYLRKFLYLIAFGLLVWTCIYYTKPIVRNLQQLNPLVRKILHIR